MALNPHLSINSAIKLLTSTLRDPKGSDTCPTRLQLAAGVIDRAFNACDSQSAKIKVAKSHPELLRVGIKFLTFKRSPKGFENMINRFLQCRCCCCDFGQTGMRGGRAEPPSSRQTDGRLSDHLVDSVFHAVSTVAHCIVLALSELTQHKFRTGSSTDDEKHWPQGTDDLLPFGPKDSVAALDLWVVRPPNGYMIFRLAGSLATFYAPFGTEIFQYSNYTFTLARPCQYLKASITFYHDGDSSPSSRQRFFTSPISQILKFLDNLLQVDPVQYRRMLVARGDWLKPVLTPLMTILSTLPSGDPWNRFRVQVNFLNSYANAKLDPNTGVPLVKFDLDLFGEVNEELDLVEQAFYLMRDTRKLGCCNVQCPSQSEVIHLRLCSRCTLVRFCGRKCQKDAWNFAPLPHKAVCTQIHSLKEAFGGKEWSLMLTPDFSYAQFQALCRRKNVDTAVAREIAAAVSAVWISRSAFMEDLMQATFAGLL